MRGQEQNGQLAGCRAARLLSTTKPGDPRQLAGGHERFLWYIICFMKEQKLVADLLSYFF